MSSTNVKMAVKCANQGWVPHHEGGENFPVSTVEEAKILLAYMDTCRKPQEGSEPLKDWEIRDARILQVLREGTREEQVACAMQSRALFNEVNWMRRFGHLKLNYWTAKEV